MTTPAWTPERFRELQAALNLTNAEMAARLLTSIGAVRKWRGGERYPRRHVVRQLVRLEWEVKQK